MRTLLVAAFATLVACGGGSGIDTDKQVVELTETEIDDLCDYIIEQQGDARTETCMDDEGEFTVEFPDFDECVDFLLSYSEDCPSTVRQEEECAEKLGDNPCDDPAACHASDDC
jgi:hypothetical protein